MMFVLMFYLWTASTNMSGLLATAEFSTKANCEAAAQQAKKAFESPLYLAYHICVDK